MTQSIDQVELNYEKIFDPATTRNLLDKAKPIVNKLLKDLNKFNKKLNNCRSITLNVISNTEIAIENLNIRADLLVSDISKLMESLDKTEDALIKKASKAVDIYEKKIVGKLSKTKEKAESVRNLIYNSKMLYRNDEKFRIRNGRVVPKLSKIFKEELQSNSPTRAAWIAVKAKVKS